MRQLTVHKNDENQRLDKYLKKYLKEAPGSFIYKMLRKKNIVLNGKKADGTEKPFALVPFLSVAAMALYMF